jgi:hypothetical protein
MTTDWEEKFIETKTQELFGNARTNQRHGFSRRFHPENRQQTHTQVAKAIQQQVGEENFSLDGINQTINQIVKRIRENWGKAMEADGIDLSQLQAEKGGQKQKQKTPWQVVYDWLWETEFPRWQGQQIWQSWVEKADKYREWLRFEPPAEAAAVGTTRMKTNNQPLQPQKITVNRGYKAVVNLKGYEKRPWLFLNRGDNGGLVVSPSRDFAPEAKITRNPLLLPQANADMEVIEFEEPMTEEFLAIVLTNPIDLPWFRQQPTPEWDGLRLGELWEELEKQPKWSVFYRAIEVCDG